MAISNTKKDVHNWKVTDFRGNVLLDSKGNPLNKFDGYASANAVAKERGGVAQRV